MIHPIIWEDVLDWVSQLNGIILGEPSINLFWISSSLWSSGTYFSNTFWLLDIVLQVLSHSLRKYDIVYQFDLSAKGFWILNDRYNKWLSLIINPMELILGPWMSPSKAWCLVERLSRIVKGAKLQHQGLNYIWNSTGFILLTYQSQTRLSTI